MQRGRGRAGGGALSAGVWAQVGGALELVEEGELLLALLPPDAARGLVCSPPARPPLSLLGGVRHPSSAGAVV
jgi:hypothetical protein